MRGERRVLQSFFQLFWPLSLINYSTLNMGNSLYSLGEILAVAETHPFYKEEIQYPLDEKAIEELREKALEDTEAEEKLNIWPIIWKKNLLVDEIYQTQCLLKSNRPLVTILSNGLSTIRTSITLIDEAFMRVLQVGDSVPNHYSSGQMRMRTATIGPISATFSKLSA